MFWVFASSSNIAGGGTRSDPRFRGRMASHGPLGSPRIATRNRYNAPELEAWTSGCNQFTTSERVGILTFESTRPESESSFAKCLRTSIVLPQVQDLVPGHVKASLGVEESPLEVRFRSVSLLPNEGSGANCEE